MKKVPIPPLQKNDFPYPFVTNVTYFEQNHPEGLNRTMHINGLLQITLEGEALIVSGEENIHLVPGTVVYFTPDSILKCVAQEGWVHRWITFYGHEYILGLLDWPPVGEGLRKIHINSDRVWDKVQSTLDEIHEAYHVFRIQRRLDLCFNLLHKLLLWMDEANPLTHPPAEDPRILEAVNYIREHYNDNITIEKLARLVHLSTGRFAHLFQGITGVTPVQYIRNIRLSRAQEMLLTTESSLGEIAEECGFCNEFYLSNVFKKKYGMRPSVFQKEHRSAKLQEL